MLTLARRHNQRGFTLAEILVTTAVFAIIMIAALAVYDRSNQTFKSGTEAADLQQSTRVGFDKLVSDVRMAGFDYNRGGAPSDSSQAAQPDEQIEYAGPTAIVFRSNFNYNSATGSCGTGTAPCGNGLEPAYTPKNVKGLPIFPYVTTSNDEIIAYVLRSTDSSKNTGSISFYVDDFQPRAAFPNNIDPAPAGNNQSKAEERLVIPNIDTTNQNPPYTLYRVTVTDVKNNSLGTPVAENIRSMNFQYYTDYAGTTLLKNPDGTDITTGRNADGTTFDATGTGAIGGDGKFDPNNPPTGNFNDRLQRAQITGIRVSLVGLNANPDLQGYTNPTETVASIQKYRQYSLSSLVVPRNLGLTGFPEPNYNPPSAPTITALCTGHCAVSVIYWNPPTTGQATTYHIEWDTNQNGAFANGMDVTDPSLRSAVLPDTGDDPSLPHWYRMEAVNDNGPSPPSSPPWQATPKNRTQPAAPTAAGSGGQANKITLQLTAPSSNVAGKNTLSCSGTGGSTDGSAIPQQESLQFRVQRSVDSSFSTDPGVNILDPLGGGVQPNPAPLPGQTVAWDDSGANSAYYPANCTPYYYRVQAMDRCCKQNVYNASGNAADSISAPSGIVGPFQATSSAAPVPPGQVGIDYLNTKCPDPNNPAQCIIKVTWPAAVSDIAGNKIGVDQYAVTRAFRISGSGAAFTTDPTFGTLGTRTVNCDTGTCSVGYSQIANATPRTYTDTPPLKNGLGALLDYRYTVAAKNCSLYSGNSPYGVTEAAQNAQTTPSGPNPYVDYPGCPTNATVTPSSVYGGTQGNGDTPTSPYILLAGDSVSITPAPPVGTTVNSVQFQLYTYPTPVQVGTTTTINAPGNAGVYTYAWGQQTPGSTYMLVMTVNTTYQGSPCKDVHIKYIQQEATVGCFFNQATSSPSVQQGSSGTATGTFDFTASSATRVTNTSSIASPLGDMKLAMSSPSFTGSTAITWSDTTAQHPEMVLGSVEWHLISSTGTDTIIGTTTVNSPAAYNKNGTGIGTSTLTTTVAFPTSGSGTWPAIPPGSSLSFKIKFTYDATKGNKNLSANQISKVCITYRTLLEPTNDKHCNLLGSGSNNPQSCN